MKKIITILTAAAILMSSCSGGGAGEAAPETVQYDTEFGIVLADGDGMTDGKIAVQSVSGSHGGELYYIVTNSEIGSPGGALPLVLNAEIGAALTNNDWLHIYEAGDGGNMAKLCSVKIPHDKIGNLLVGPLEAIYRRRRNVARDPKYCGRSRQQAGDLPKPAAYNFVYRGLRMGGQAACWVHIRRDACGLRAGI